MMPCAADILGAPRGRDHGVHWWQDHTHSDATRAFRLSKRDDYLHTYTDWLTDAAHVIDTSHIATLEAADQIAALITSGH